MTPRGKREQPGVLKWGSASSGSFLLLADPLSPKPPRKFFLGCAYPCVPQLLTWRDEGTRVTMGTPGGGDSGATAPLGWGQSFSSSPRTLHSQIWHPGHPKAVTSSTAAPFPRAGHSAVPSLSSVQPQFRPLPPPGPPPCLTHRPASPPKSRRACPGLCREAASRSSMHGLPSAPKPPNSSRVGAVLTSLRYL